MQKVVRYLQKVIRLISLIFTPLILFAIPLIWIWHKTRSYRVKHRLHIAKRVAFDLSLEDNGRRYWVLEDTPDHFIVLNRDEIDKVFHKRKITELLKNAKYYTPSGVKFSISVNPFAPNRVAQVGIGLIILTIILCILWLFGLNFEIV